jgi:hypothetical protein
LIPNITYITSNGFYKTFKLFGDPSVTIAIPRGAFAPKNPPTTDQSVNMFMTTKFKLIINL